MQEGVVSIAVQKSAFVDFRDGIISKAFDLAATEIVDRGADKVKGVKVFDMGDEVLFRYYVDEPLEEDPKQPYLFPLEEIAKA